MFTCRGERLLHLAEKINTGRASKNIKSCDSKESPCPELDPELEEMENDILENEIDGISDDEDRDPDYIPEDSVSNEPMLPNPTECSAAMKFNDPDSPSPDLGNQLDKPKTRNKIPNPSNWKRNEIKRKIRTGEEHQSVSERTIAAKRVKFQDCSKCVRKCNENFPESKREEINQDYWNLGDVDKQRLFLNSLVTEVGKKVTRTAAVVSR